MNVGIELFCDEAVRHDSAKLTPGWLSQRRLLMSERDWKEEKRSVLGRLFDTAFGRRETSEEETRDDVHWLGTVNKHLDDED
jgi:hypothetical protein